MESHQNHENFQITYTNTPTNPTEKKIRWLLSDGVVYWVQNKTTPTEHDPFWFCFGRSGFYDEVTTLITGKVLVLFLHDKILETIHNIYCSIINSFRQQNTTKIQPSIYK